MARLWGVCSVMVIAACGYRSGRSDQRAALLSDVPSERPPGSCEVVLTPAVLPRADSLVDSAALVALGRRWRKHGVSGGHVLLTLAYDGNGHNRRIAVLEHNVPANLADSAWWAVRNALRNLQHERDSTLAPWGVRLRLDMSADEIRTRVGRQEYCSPRALDATLQDEIERRQSEGIRYRGGRLERTILMTVWVHPAGYVTRTSISRGIPLTTTMEQRLVDYVKQFSFLPALLDGEPVEGWIEIPVQLRN